MAAAVRYRLRFLLQEFDLPPGTTMLGRSTDCHITIEDPLVSRQHARIDLEAGVATLKDLGSRNGVKVNGAPVRETARLQNGDRVRIGTQEFVFTQVDVQGMSSKTTGFLRHCAVCRMPYPEEVGVCPSCGATEWLEEDTLTARIGHQQRGWEITLFAEMVERALRQDRIHDAERMLRRASAEVEERLARGEMLDEDTVGALLVGTSRVALAATSASWACWVVRLFRRLPFAPSASMLEPLGALLRGFPQEVVEALDELLAYYDQHPHHDLHQTERRAALARLRSS